MPDQGTTPISRNTERRTQAGDLFLDVSAESESRSNSESPLRAARVISRARGKRYVRNGARGVARRVAHAEPVVVRTVRKSVARAGENKAPASTFFFLKRTEEKKRDTD